MIETHEIAPPLKYEVVPAIAAAIEADATIMQTVQAVYQQTEPADKASRFVVVLEPSLPGGYSESRTRALAMSVQIRAECVDTTHNPAQWHDRVHHRIAEIIIGRRLPLGHADQLLTVNRTRAPSGIARDMDDFTFYSAAEYVVAINPKDT